MATQMFQPHRNPIYPPRTSLQHPQPAAVDSLIEAWIRSVEDHNNQLVATPQFSTSSRKRKASLTSCTRSQTSSPWNMSPIIPSTPQTRKSARLQLRAESSDDEPIRARATNAAIQMTADVSESPEQTPTQQSYAARPSRGLPSPTRSGRSIPQQPPPPPTQDPYIISLRNPDYVFNPPPITENRIPSPTRSASSRTSTRSGRSTSSVKRMADLELSAKPIILQTLSSAPKILPDTERALLKNLRRIAQGKEVIPRGVRRLVKRKISSQDNRPTQHNFYEPTALSRDGLDERRRPVSEQAIRRELSTISKISSTARLWMSESVNEASWNSMVHCPILELALFPLVLEEEEEEDDGLDTDDYDSDEDDDESDQTTNERNGISIYSSVRFWDITTARPHSDFIPRNPCGDLLETKMVDFCLTVSDETVQQAALRTLNAAAVPGRKTFRSINHTEYAPLTRRPISVNIESKTPEGSPDKALSQLSLWAACQFERLRMLRAFQADLDGLEDLSDGCIPVALPLLLAIGSQWRLYFALDTADKVIIVDAIKLGDTDQLVGCYQVVAALRELARWTETEYRAWLLENVLVG